MSAGLFAQETTVPVDRSRNQIEAIIEKYGGTGFAYAKREGSVGIEFEIENRQIRFIVSLPKKGEFRTIKQWEQATRSTWRSLHLAIKAKLEIVQIGIATVDEEFLANIILKTGGTVGDAIIPAIEKSYIDGQVPKMLPLLE